VNALCLIPPTNFPKGAPVSASVRLPVGTVEVQYWLVVADRMQKRPQWRGSVEVRFRLPDGDFTESGMTGNRMVGNPDITSGGVANGLPADLPSSCVMFDFDPRQSGGGGTPIVDGASHCRLTMIPQEGNNGGAIWCGAVVAAFDADGNALTFDPATRGS
jgi:hypothetical protein